MVVMSYNSGIVLCKQYFERLNGVSMARPVRYHFLLAFSLSASPKSKRILQYRCSVQNSKKAKKAIERLGPHLFCTSARSPDINTIENFIHKVGQKLRHQVLNGNITHDEEFSVRVKRTLKEFPSGKNRQNPIAMIIKAKGLCIKY